MNPTSLLYLAPDTVRHHAGAYPAAKPVARPVERMLAATGVVAFVLLSLSVIAALT